MTGDLQAMVALAQLSGVGPRRLWAASRSGPAQVWRDLVARRTPAGVPAPRSLCERWWGEVESVSVENVFADHTAGDLFVSAAGLVGAPVLDGAGPEHPAHEPDDPYVPPLLFWRAWSPERFDALHRRPRVAIVGTRRASRYGLDVAHELGGALAEAGVVVVSGLALGIDAAAHRGAIAANGAPPIAIVASGHNVVYPRRNRELWEAVARAGAIGTTAPLGTAPEAWRFPARNRVIVGLSDVVVVVESHHAGGSLITADYAGARGVPVLAVPGPIRSATSLGTNRLLGDGCGPCLGVDDVLVALGLQGADVRAAQPETGEADRSSDDRAVLDALGWESVTLDEVVARSGRPFAVVASSLASLESEGLVAATAGRFERCAGGSDR
jgi:DNA processing protein